MNVNLAASNIPIGTIVTLRLSSETNGDSLIACNPLAGASVASTTATCTATFPFSVTITSARATWQGDGLDAASTWAWCTTAGWLFVGRGPLFPKKERLSRTEVRATG